MVPAPPFYLRAASLARLLFTRSILASLAGVRSAPALLAYVPIRRTLVPSSLPLHSRFINFVPAKGSWLSLT